MLHLCSFVTQFGILPFRLGKFARAPWLRARNKISRFVCRRFTKQEHVYGPRAWHTAQVPGEPARHRGGTGARARAPPRSAARRSCSDARRAPDGPVTRPALPRGLALRSEPPASVPRERLPARSSGSVLVPTSRPRPRGGRTVRGRVDRLPAFRAGPLVSASAASPPPLEVRRTATATAACEKEGTAFLPTRDETSGRGKSSHGHGLREKSAAVDPSQKQSPSTQRDCRCAGTADFEATTRRPGMALGRGLDLRRERGATALAPRRVRGERSRETRRATCHGPTTFAAGKHGNPPTRARRRRRRDAPIPPTRGARDNVPPSSRTEQSADKK